MKKNNKGFTLVELIVVLVILAILAAILVPALLGYIDKARQGQYEEEVHSILTATQAKATEEYAKSTTTNGPASIADIKDYINPIVAPTIVTSGDIEYNSPTATSRMKNFTVTGITSLNFTSQDGKAIVADVKDGAVTIKSVDGVSTGK
ncbi:MAG: type II secretion system protein [Eubacterium sp.]|nr:type II secretion system protein [Eubacterium sp.]